MTHKITLIPGDGIGHEVEALCGRERSEAEREHAAEILSAAKDRATSPKQK
jgi:isocitrate/isopropylmalate dehydrogenase